MFIHIFWLCIERAKGSRLAARVRLHCFPAHCIAVPCIGMCNQLDAACW
jgi:hypothetical protein